MDPSDQEIITSTPFKGKKSIYTYLRSFFSAQERNIGLYIESNIIAWACIEKKRDELQLLFSAMTESWDQYKKNQEIPLIPPDRVYRSIALEASKTLYRKVTIPVTVSEKNRKMALIDKLEQDLPSSIQLFPEEGKESLYIFSAALQEKNDHFFSYDTYISLRKDIDDIALLHKEIGNSIDAIFPKIGCLQAFAQTFLPEDRLFLIIDMTLQETTLLLYSGKQIELIRSISSGLISLAALDEENPSSSQIDEMRSFLDSLVECTQSAFPSSQEHNHDDAILVLTGPISSSELYSSCIEEYIQIDRYQSTLLSEKNLISATEIGAAILGSEKNIFSAEYTVPDLLKSANLSSQTLLHHIKRPFLLLILISCIFSFCLFFYTIQEKSRLRNEVKKEWENFYEKAISTPLFSQEKTILTEAKKEPFDIQEVEESLTNLEREVLKNGCYTLNPPIMNMKEVIQTLDSLIRDIEKRESDEATAALQLQSLRYSTIKKPDARHPKDPYQVRIELEFTSESPAVARSFYDALLLCKTLVDSKSDVKWTATNGRYKTSFYLRHDLSI